MGLDHSPLHDISGPVIAAALAVAVLAGYAAAVRAAGFDALVVEPAPRTLLRDDSALALFGMTTVIFAPVAEELLFRGLILRRLLSFGPWPAVVGSAIVFAAWHASPAVVPLLLIGGILGWLYLRSATLWQPITFHVLFNLVSFVQFAGHR
jgi:membrane protease YdiL (CAAX protease family)